MFKKRALKALISLIISAVLLICQAPISASEADGGKCGPSLYWSYDDNTNVLTVSGDGRMYDYSNFSNELDCSPFSVYRGNTKAIVIEEGCTYIGTYAFSGFLHVVNVVFPESSLKEIGAYAFNYCTDVTRIVIPDSVEVLGNSAFTTCQSLKMIRFGKGITTLPSSVCSRATELVSVFLSENCKTIGISAFYECKNLVSVDISAVETVEANAFNGCKALTKITFGENVKRIGENSFYACSALSEFEFLKAPDLVASGFAYGTAWYNAKPDGLYVICDEILLCKGVYSDTALTVPDGIKCIADSAFTNNSNIKTVTLPDGLERIGEFAFFKNSNLTAIEIPESVVFIGNMALGYKPVGTSQYTINPNYVISGKGGVAWEYAATLGINYICLHEYEEKSAVNNCTLGGVSFEECIFCGDRTNEKEILPLASHELETEERAATCEEDGIIKSRCKNCNAFFEETTAATGHTAGVWQVIKEATCAEYGVIGRPCIKCNSLIEEKKIEKTEHAANTTLKEVKAKTCTEDGISKKCCKYCDEILETITVKADGHSPDEDFTTVKEAADGVPGYEVKYCTVCGTVTEGRWFEDSLSVMESREAAAVCKKLMIEVLTGASSVSEASLDFNSDGELNVKDSILLKRISD